MPQTFTRPRVFVVVLLGMVCAGAGGLAQRITQVMPDAARPLPLPAVRLTGGPLRRAQDLNGEYLLKLEPDRMLAFYRQRAGLEAKAPLTTESRACAVDGITRGLEAHEEAVARRIDLNALTP